MKKVLSVLSLVIVLTTAWVLPAHAVWVSLGTVCARDVIPNTVIKFEGYNGKSMLLFDIAAKEYFIEEALNTNPPRWVFITGGQKFRLIVSTFGCVTAELEQ